MTSRSKRSQRQRGRALQEGATLDRRFDREQTARAVVWRSVWARGGPELRSGYLDHNVTSGENRDEPGQAPG